MRVIGFALMTVATLFYDLNLAEDVEAARQAGTNGYLAQPLNPAELRSALEGRG